MRFTMRLETIVYGPEVCSSFATDDYNADDDPSVNDHINEEHTLLVTYRLRVCTL